MSGLGGGLRLSAAVLVLVVSLGAASAGAWQPAQAAAQTIEQRTDEFLNTIPLTLRAEPQPDSQPEQPAAPPVPPGPDPAAALAEAVATAQADAAWLQTQLGSQLDVLVAQVHYEVQQVERTAQDSMAILAAPPSGPEPETAPSPASAEATLVGVPPILVLSAAVASAAAATLFGFWIAGSSTTVGAAGSSALSSKAALSKDLRRLLPFASPLFTRFERDTVLGHPRREAIYALILQQPGVSLQLLGEETGLSRTAVLHHLRLLEQQHLIVSIRKGRSRHYYENGGRFGHDQKDAYAVLQNERSRQVANYIRANPGALQKALCAALAIQPSIAHWHVRRLAQAKLVESIHQGRTVSYFPAAALSGMPPAPAVAPVAVPALTA